ncbi:MAG: transcriptional repressor [Gammaproteobacteria bacterium]|nr:transcriptional repressor [Gammaproteobacteria bacterium]
MSVSTLDKIHSYSQQQGIRLTNTRLAVLSLLAESTRPLSAYQLLEGYQQRYQKSYQPTTVYRVLTFLEQHGLVHKLAATRQYVLCQELGKKHGRCVEFLHCDKCGNLTEVPDMESIYQALQSQTQHLGFTLNQPTLELHGVCARCQV